MKTKIGITALLIVIPLYLFADPAKKVTLSYDKESKNLHIVAAHPTGSTSSHFIDEVRISVDGKEVKVLNLKKQTNLKEEVIDVKIQEIKKGSKVVVKTHCNQFGNKKGKLTIK